MNILLSKQQISQILFGGTPDKLPTGDQPISPTNTSTPISSNVDSSQIALAKSINSFDKATVGYRGVRSDASGSCVQATLYSARHAQKLLGTEPSKIIGNNISNIANKGLTGRFQGQSMKAIQEAFLRGEIRVGDTLSLGDNLALKDVGSAQDSGGGHHALIVTYLGDEKGNLILDANGRPQIGFLDNCAGKQVLSWNDFTSKYSAQFPKILEIGRPTYGKTSSLKTVASA